MLNAWIPVGRPTGIPLCLHPSVKDVVIEPVNHVVILDTRLSARRDEIGCPFRQGRTRGCAPTLSILIFPHLDRLQICLTHLFIQT